MRNFIIKTLSTFFYVGYLPFIPGTLGTIAGVLLYLFLKDNILVYLTVWLGLLIAGFWASGEAEKIFKMKDCRCIVIDEVTGILLCFLFIPYDIRLVIAGFLIFRLLDAFKPYPAVVFQKFKAGLGVMSDDLVAGIYTNIVLQVVFRLSSFIAS